jgi:hypothetical protein
MGFSLLATATPASQPHLKMCTFCQANIWRKTWLADGDTLWLNGGNKVGRLRHPRAAAAAQCPALSLC